MFYQESAREIFKVSCVAIATDPTLAEGTRAMQEQDSFLVGIPRRVANIGANPDLPLLLSFAGLLARR
jgi:hypothetical protein